MRYEATRFVDFFRPGQEIPAGHYDANTLKRLAEKGLIAPVDEGEAVEETKRPRKQAAKAKSSR